MRTAEFFATHPVFSLDEATAALAPPSGRPGTVRRLRHHLASGRVARAARGVYAVVPLGATAARFDPDPILVAAAARPDAVFAYHSALELLGVGHSTWAHASVFTARRREPILLDSSRISFYGDPPALATSLGRTFATRRVERRGRLLVVTGPERTVVEGLRRPPLVGGVEELLLSAAAVPTLDLGLLHELLQQYDTARLWAATGWLLERLQRTWSVPDAFLDLLEAQRPVAALYLQREQRGGRLEPRWNLVVPEVAYHMSTTDER